MSARHHRRRRRYASISAPVLQGLMILGIIAGGLAALLVYNTQPVQSFVVPGGAVASFTPTQSNWQGMIATRFLLYASPIPTIDATQAAAYKPPTPGWQDATPVAYAPAQIMGVSTPTPTRDPGLPTQTPTPGPSPTPTVTPLLPAAPAATATDSGRWNPPSMPEPLALKPRDHFWLQRPIEANWVNYGLEWYHYGSNGLDDNMRVHHGEDFGNPRGVRVVAAGPGTVIWADNGIEVMRPIEGRDQLWLEKITSYGNVMVIEHDFSYRGQPVYTLYAHLSAFVKAVGDHVEAGEVIGLVGATGVVGGPHLHLEVRIGWNSYYYTRNPYLWIVPYVGTGVIAGRLTHLGTDEPVIDNVLTLVDKHTGRVVSKHTTYGETVNPDDEWHENFLFSDVPVGDYEVVTWIHGTRLVADVTVQPGVTNFIETWTADEDSEIPATPQSIESAE